MLVAIAGGFDPIHSGHIDHIKEARKLVGQGGTLCVILARDDQLIKKKGFVFQKYAERYEIVSNIKGVKVVVQNQDVDTSCAQTLTQMKPDIFAKGGDRGPGNMPQAEIDVCREHNIKLVYGIGRQLGSSTELVKQFQSPRKKVDYW